jgi:hypothetical protein
MNEHLAEISRCVSVGAIALLVLDGAGWHSSPRLTVPDNIALLPLPPYSPELNPVENVWELHRQSRYLTIVPRAHIDRRDAENGRCNASSHRTRPKPSYSLIRSSMATFVHGAMSWQLAFTVRCGPQRSGCGSRRRAPVRRPDLAHSPGFGSKSPSAS